MILCQKTRMNTYELLSIILLSSHPVSLAIAILLVRVEILLISIKEKNRQLVSAEFERTEVSVDRSKEKNEDESLNRQLPTTCERDPRQEVLLVEIDIHTVQTSKKFFVSLTLSLDVCLPVHEYTF